MDLRTIGARLRDGKETVAGLREASLAKAQGLGREINAFVSLLETDSEAAASQVAEASRMLEQGDGGPLCGIPVAYKDNMCTIGARTTCASRLLGDYVPPYESHATSLMAQAGAVCVGKCNMDEFAMGTTGEQSAHGPTTNPWDGGRSAGGSSSGSAAAVAARIVPVALGSDTGGSVRTPAAYCGISGMKPTYGAISRRGIVAYASSLDQVGVLATTAACLRATLSVIAQHDEADSTSLADANALVGARKDIKGMRVGVAEEFFASGIDPAVADLVRQSIAKLESLGCEIKPVAMPNLSHAIAAYYIIACAEASSNLSRYDGMLYGSRADSEELAACLKASRSEGFGPEVKRRIMLGTFVLSHGYVDAYYRQAQKIRRMISLDFAKAFAQCDVIATPAAPNIAPKLGEFDQDPVKMYMQDICTVTANLGGVPALSVPCGLERDMPVGLQLMGPARHDGRLLDVAEAYQEATEHHLQVPAMAK